MRDSPRPDGRPWTNVRSTAELREAFDRGWLAEQIEVDSDAIGAEAFERGYEAGHADGIAGREPTAAAQGARSAQSGGTGSGAAERTTSGAWDAIVEKWQTGERE